MIQVVKILIITAILVVGFLSRKSPAEKAKIVNPPSKEEESLTAEVGVGDAKKEVEEAGGAQPPNVLLYYPNATTGKEGTRTVYHTPDSPRAVTAWFKDTLAARSNTTSFVTTTVNSVVENVLSDGIVNISISGEIDGPTEITVDYD